MLKDQVTKMLIDRASIYIGVTEEGKDNCGRQVEEFQRAVDGKASREAWCMAFVQHCLKETLKKIASDKVKIAVFASEHCMTVWNKTDPKYRTAKPEVGCLVIWQFYKNGKATASGHTGIVTKISPDGKSIETIEGNTGPGGDVVREGDGVYKKVRNAKGSATMKVVGFVKPFDVQE